LHLPVVREEKDGPFVLFRQLLGLQQARTPADLVEALLVRGRLPLRYAPINERYHIFIGDLGGLVCKQQSAYAEDAKQ
jgi:hypothetical protein